jgi:hypothetical protein
MTWTHGSQSWQRSSAKVLSNLVSRLSGGTGYDQSDCCWPAATHTASGSLMRFRMLAPAVLLVALSAHAQEGVWLGESRDALPDTEYRKSESGFGGALLVTSDLDWHEKWNTSPETIPHFNQASDVRLGERLVILTFFVNPMTTSGDVARVLCAVRVTRPDSTRSVDLKDFPCLAGRLQGDPNHVRLAPTVLNFVGEPEDPLGTWVVEVALTDAVRDTELRLRTSFVLRE